MRRPLLPALALALLAACSTTKTLDSGDLETTLSSNAAQQLPGVEIGEAECPDDIEAEAGSTFECTIDVAGQEVSYQVVQDDDEGNVTFTRSQAVLDIDKLTSEVTNGIEAQTGVEVTVTCPGGPIRVETPQSTFTCTATTEQGEQRSVEITVTDVEGNVDWQLG